MTSSIVPRRTARATSSIWRTGALAVFAGTALSACDIPTAFPRIENRFIVPGESTTLSVNELLPAGVTATGNGFRLTMAAVPIPRQTLADMCGQPCVTSDDQMTPKPAFNVEIPTTVNLPASVESAVLTGGSFVVSLTHNLGFDLLQPSGRSQDGSIAISVRSGSREISSNTMTGAFPSGSTRTITLTLAPGEISGDLNVNIVVNSPAGGIAPEHWIRIDADAALSGQAVPGAIDISQASVTVQNQSVSAAGSTIDLSDIDDTMRDNVARGAIVLQMSNPFAVTGTMQLVLQAGATTISKPVQIQAGQTTQRIEFTGAELRSLLGQVVTMTLQGTIGSTSPITVTPSDAITVSTMLDLTFELGAGDS